MEVSVFHLLNNLYIRLISNYNFIIDKINHYLEVEMGMDQIKILFNKT